MFDLWRAVYAVGVSWVPAINDFVALLLSAGMLAAYQVYLYLRVRRDPGYTVQALMRLARTAWVEDVMADRKEGTLAVQTLRNSTMAASFMGSTAVLLIIGTLTLSGQGDKLDATWHSLNAFGATDPRLWAIKLMFLVVSFLIAFFSFTMSIRFYNHVGYLINVPAERRYKKITPLRVAAHLNKAGRFYSLGMRAYYFAVPLVFWLFGPHFMLLSTVGLIIVLYFVDRGV